MNPAEMSHQLLLAHQHYLPAAVHRQPQGHINVIQREAIRQIKVIDEELKRRKENEMAMRLYAENEEIKKANERLTRENEELKRMCAKKEETNNTQMELLKGVEKACSNKIAQIRKESDRLKKEVEEAKRVCADIEETKKAQVELLEEGNKALLDEVKLSWKTAKEEKEALKREVGRLREELAEANEIARREAEFSMAFVKLEYELLD